MALFIQTLEFVKCLLVLGVNNSPVTIDTLNTCSWILGWGNMVLISQVLLIHWYFELLSILSAAIRLGGCLSYVKIGWSNMFIFIFHLLGSVSKENLTLTKRIFGAIFLMVCSTFWMGSAVQISSKIILTAFLDKFLIDLGLKFRTR